MLGNAKGVWNSKLKLIGKELSLSEREQVTQKMYVCGGRGLKGGQI